MKILELFSGTESFSKVARERGHETFTVDNDKQFSPNLCIDIMDLTQDMIPFKPDIIWASPPCTTFSVASIRHYWDNGKPKNEKCLHGIAIVKKTIDIIKQLNPKYFIIENPRGMLRKQEFMDEFKRDTVTYCQYGDNRMKPTDIWTNNKNWKPRPMCKNGSPCHEAAPRGSKTGTQGLKGSVNRSRIPEELCMEIFNAVNPPTK